MKEPLRRFIGSFGPNKGEEWPLVHRAEEHQASDRLQTTKSMETRTGQTDTHSTRSVNSEVAQQQRRDKQAPCKLQEEHGLRQQSSPLHVPRPPSREAEKHPSSAPAPPSSLPKEAQESQSTDALPLSLQPGVQHGLWNAAIERSEGSIDLKNNPYNGKYYASHSDEYHVALRCEPEKHRNLAAPTLLVSHSQGLQPLHVPSSRPFLCIEAPPNSASVFLGDIPSGEGGCKHLAASVLQGRPTSESWQEDLEEHIGPTISSASKDILGLEGLLHYRQPNQAYVFQRSGFRTHLPCGVRSDAFNVEKLMSCSRTPHDGLQACNPAEHMDFNLVDCALVLGSPAGTISSGCWVGGIPQHTSRITCEWETPANIALFTPMAQQHLLQRHMQPLQGTVTRSTTASSFSMGLSQPLDPCKQSLSAACSPP
ncbi:hypothetical protein cyc_00591 [Cyclospora cayetanensis]|uniref:Uncharacterized protein n=1 Tax=Cyclospora cayetanensis TaxID=88456 RepID=A0A1D3CYR0_9EIME|nr:hypothetical protein cyc_00591 [Cyclospora cayetanensis]